jgi:hypothetical protein
MNSKNSKIFFAIVAVALMMVSPIALGISNIDIDAAATKDAGAVPEGGTYQYIIKQSTDGTTISDVQVYVDGAWTSKMRTDTTVNEFWTFTDGLGPFNSFYAAINLYEESADDYVEKRINTKVGGIAYVLDPEHLDQTMQGTAYTASNYNIMLVIPKVYWMATTVNSNNYLLMSNVKNGTNFTSAENLDAVDFNANAQAYAHTFTSVTENDTTFDYIAIGVYEGSVVSNKLVSQPDKVPAASKNIASFRINAENNTSDYGSYMLWNGFQWTLYKMMSYTVLGNKDVQYMLGRGNTGVASETGTATAITGKGTTTTTPYDTAPTANGSSVTGQATSWKTASAGNESAPYKGVYASLFLENSWGSVWEFVDDIFIGHGNDEAEGKYNSIYMNNLLSFTELNSATQKDTSVDWVSTGTSGRAISEASTAQATWDMPITTDSTSISTSDGTKINDAVWFNSSIETVLFAGGRWDSGLSAGLAAAYANYALGFSTSAIGARLAYALTADAAVADESGSDYIVDIDASDMVSVKAGNKIIEDGDSVKADTKLTVTLNSRIPVGEKVIITTYSMLGSPLFFDSSSAIGDVLSFTPTEDVFIYLDNGMIDSVVYQPTIYDVAGAVKEGKEAIEVVLNDSVSNYVWSTYRIADSSNNVKQSDSFYFTGDTIVIELDKSSVTMTNDGERYKYDGGTFTADANGAWAKGVASTKYYIAEGGTFYAMNNESTPAMTEFVITSSLIEGINDSYNASLVKSTDHPGFFELTVAAVTDDLYVPYESTHYDDWKAGTYYFSLQTENSYIDVVNFKFSIGAYKVTYAVGSEQYFDAVTVNGVERYTLNANEVAQIQLNAQAISKLDEFHVYMAYGDELREVQPVRTGLYRFIMPAADVELSITQASGYSMGLMYKYGTGFSIYIINNSEGEIPEGTVSAEGYAVVGGKLYDGTEFSAVIHDTLFTADVDPTTKSYLVQALEFDDDKNPDINSLSQITAIVPSFSIESGVTISGNQYFATGYTKTADNGAISVRDGNVQILVNDPYVDPMTADPPTSVKYTLTVYYNYDIATGESTQTVMDSFQVKSGSLTQRSTVITIDYEGLGIDEDKVVMYRAYIGDEQTLDVAI